MAKHSIFEITVETQDVLSVNDQLYQSPNFKGKKQQQIERYLKNIIQMIKEDFKEPSLNPKMSPLINKENGEYAIGIMIDDCNQLSVAGVSWARGIEEKVKQNIANAVKETVEKIRLEKEDSNSDANPEKLADSKIPLKNLSKKQVKARKILADMKNLSDALKIEAIPALTEASLTDLIKATEDCPTLQRELTVTGNVEQINLRLAKLRLIGDFSGTLNVPMTFENDYFIEYFYHALISQRPVKVNIQNPKMFENRTDATVISEVKVEFDFSMEQIRSDFESRADGTIFLDLLPSA